MRRGLLVLGLMLLPWGCEENFNDVYLGPLGGNAGEAGAVGGGAGGAAGQATQGGAAGQAGDSGAGGDKAGTGGDGGAGGDAGTGAGGDGGDGGNGGVAGTAGEAGAGGTSTACEAGEKRCTKDTVENCTQGQWKAEPTPCRWGCQAGACEVPVEIHAGRATSYARMSGGSVWSWGENNAGQLGQGVTGGSSSKPARIEALAGVTQVATHSDHACAVGSGGVWCWGRNEGGWIAPGGASLATPTPITGLSKAVEVAVGGRHACARQATGEVLCWGEGKRGQLGQGKREDSAAPIQVAGLGKTTRLALWRARSCALLEQGGAVCWGLRGADEGAGPEEDELAPTPITDTQGATEILGGDFFGCVRSVGLRCWGANDRKQIGTAAIFEVAAKNLTGLSGLSRVALGWRHGCAALSNGLVKCWGASDDGQTGKTGVDLYPPDTVPTLFDAAQVGAGEGHSCALLSSGEAWCWGRNDRGQLGQGNQDPAPGPVQVVW